MVAARQEREENRTAVEKRMKDHPKAM